jgi:hypothetical protein
VATSRRSSPRPAGHMVTICSSCSGWTAFVPAWAQAATAVARTRKSVAISSSTSAEAKRPSGPRVLGLGPFGHRRSPPTTSHYVVIVMSGGQVRGRYWQESACRTRGCPCRRTVSTARPPWR